MSDSDEYVMDEVSWNIVEQVRGILIARGGQLGHDRPSKSEEERTRERRHLIAYFVLHYLYY